ncbi:MAG TPA: TadE family protein [Acidobacteriaceae bacterium]|nr:TadE family protein [Acidobacteriaceae bacterium]
MSFASLSTVKVGNSREFVQANLCASALTIESASPRKPPQSVRDRNKNNRQRGQAILEAAVMLPILVFIALAMIDMQWALSDAGTLDYIVSEAARCEALSALPCTAGNNAGTYATTLAANLKLTASRFSVVSYSCDPMVGSCTVTATYNYPPIGVWFPSILISRTGTAAVTTAP